MDFMIFPFVMIALCAVMMVLTMRSVGHKHVRSSTRGRDR
jgi:hypothetical protein